MAQPYEKDIKSKKNHGTMKKFSARFHFSCDFPTNLKIISDHTAVFQHVMQEKTICFRETESKNLFLF